MDNEVILPTDYCPVCGFDEGAALYDICSCCFYQPGCDDTTIEGVKKYRQEWIKNECPWKGSEHFTPPNWDPKEQMKNIPPEFL